MLAKGIAEASYEGIFLWKRTPRGILKQILEKSLTEFVEDLQMKSLKETRIEFLEEIRKKHLKKS